MTHFGICLLTLFFSLSSPAMGRFGDFCQSSPAAQTTPKIGNAVNAVEDFLGGQGKIIRNADGDTILMRGDKKIRFDIKDPHGDKPHFHLEQQTSSGKWKNAGPEHRYYFPE